MARNDGLRDYQQEMKLRLFEGTNAYRHGKDTSAGCGGERVSLWWRCRYAGVDSGTPQGAGGADRGNRSPVWNGKRTGQVGKERKDGERQYAGRIREGEGIFHPVVVTKPEDYGRTAGFDRH